MNKLWLILIFLGCATLCRAEECKDTLWTTDKDRIIITYDLRYDNEGINIRFLNAKKNLGRINGNRYKKAENVEVVFFDRTGVYDGMKFTNMTPEAFMVPSNLKYTKSEAGYFIVQDRPSLSFNRVGRENAVLTIPVYLAYYQGKTERKLFSTCKSFSIELEGLDTSKATNNNDSRRRPYTPVPEPETDNEMAAKVSIQISTVMDLLDVQTKVPFSDGLQYEITYLRNLQKEVKDKQLLTKIKECLTECELKKIELEEKASAAAKKAQIEAENTARMEREREQARQDSIAAVQQEQEKAAKKRNIWTIIGGIILAVVASVANQFIQHFRHIRNQKSMLEMQQNIARRAEYEAKRHAQSYARRKTHEAVNKARKTTQEMVQKRTKQPGGDKPKGFSI